MNVYLVSYKDGTRDLTFPLHGGGTRIGRDADCLVQLPDSRVSKRHALIRLKDNEWGIEDLGSTNGTRVNDQDVRVATLRDGDRIGIGPFEFVFTLRPIEDSRFAPDHIIDLSSQAQRQTIQRQTRE